MKDCLLKIMNWDALATKALHVPPNQKHLALILKIFAHSGDSWFWLAGLFITWLFSEHEWRERVVFISVGLVIMATAVIALKFSIRRPRPEGAWGQIYRITDPHSFPSGHSARSAALAVMGIAVGPPWFALALSFWAPWVGISRVALGIHYLSDVLVGWLMGAAMGGIAILAKPLILKMFSFFI
ncbi:MAG: phosphatase PAP2 family protein [Chloroflexota bacterium]|nr:phosphatase PAP2 family protein [Chloroflexota bacterium]